MMAVDIAGGAYTVYEDGTVTSHRRVVLKYGVSAGHARDIVLGYKRKPSVVESGVSR